MMNYILAFDVGGTNTRAGVVDNGKILLKKTAPTPEGKKTLDALVSLIESMSEDKKIKAVCLALPGVIVDESRLTAQNLRLKDYPIKAELQNKLNGKHIPIYLGNDADCFVLAEAIYGSGKKYRRVYGLTLGTGVGGGLAVDKHLETGIEYASEPGRLIIKRNGIKSVNGSYGEFEEYCSKRGILRIAKEHNLKKVKTPFDVYVLAKEGNQDALDSWSEYGDYLGVGLNKIIALAKPEIIVLGGGLSNAWPYFHEAMFKKLSELYGKNKICIVQSHLKDAGILGASLLAKN